MRNYLDITRALTVAVLLCCASEASAQLGGGRIDRPLDTPTISPYVNMLRSNGSPGLNYFGLVRPQLEIAEQNQQFGQNLQTLQTQQNQPMRMMSGAYGYSQLGVTGHPVIFNSFNNGQFSGGYTGMAGGGGGFGGGGFSGGMMGGGQAGFGGGMNPYGAPGMAGGAMGGFSGMSGHAAQFGGIGNSSQGMMRGR